ncbi:MAG: hypothetical protein JOZ89_06930 [Gammaproteobacteria bacterium]|nr:hypothetical protein [Gammaproteobacteria bacterium]
MDASVLAGWDNFYVIVGSSAGGLTGITFVVIVLVRETMQGARPAGVGAFVTPTIVHFGGVLALAAFLSMPHQHLISLSAGFALAGLAGMIYGGSIAGNMRRARGHYVPVLEDWLWNVILPTLVYGCLVVVAVMIWRWPAQTMYVVATLSLAMLFIGIRNAWDIAVWMTTHSPPPGPAE